MDAHPTTEESVPRPCATGWSPVEESWTFPRGRWVYRVVVANGRRRLAGEGRSVTGAWRRACEQAPGGTAGAD
jgi:hypothetical protein